MDQISNPVEQNLLNDLINLYTSDLDAEIHSYRHLDCLACSKRAIVNVLSRHTALISTRQALQNQLETRDLQIVLAERASTN